MILHVVLLIKSRLFLYYYSQGHKDIPRKSSLSAVKSSRRPVDFSDSEREESEYESDGEEDERSFSRKRAEEPEEEYAEEEEEEDEHDEEEAEANEESEEEVEVCRFVSKLFIVCALA